MSNQNERPVVVRLNSGAEYGLKSIAEAKRIYPNGTIVRYQDGQQIDPEDLEESGLTEQGEIEVSEKLTREQLETIATQMGIEGADNKSAYATKGDLVAAIEALNAEVEGDANGTGDGESE